MKKGDGSSRRGREVSGSSATPSRGCSGGSTKNKAAQILSDAAGAISPRMRHSFVDRQYSPSTSVYHSEWEIILGELIHMGFLVKHEPVSEGENE
jgi:hypothetical protein